VKRFAITFVGLDNCPRPKRVSHRVDIDAENRVRAIQKALDEPRGRVFSIMQINVRFVAL
jgi:hypothetical protein